MKLVKGLLLALALLCGAMTVPTPAFADSQMISIKSNSDSKVHLKFFSKTYNRVWPSADQVWVLDDYGTHNYNLACSTGEKICYGAWVAGDSSQYWGVGRYGNGGCSTCCVYCSGGSTSYTLTDDD